MCFDDVREDVDGMRVTFAEIFPDSLHRADVNGCRRANEDKGGDMTLSRRRGERREETAEAKDITDNDLGGCRRKKGKWIGVNESILISHISHSESLHILRHDSPTFIFSVNHSVFLFLSRHSPNDWITFT